MKQTINITMTTQEAIKYYANKIIEDSLTECSEFNYCMDIDYYNDKDFIEKNQDLILQELQRDERVADVTLDKQHKTFDIVFWTDYCLHYYEEYTLCLDTQITILKKFMDQLLLIKNNSMFLLNINIQQIINDTLLQNDFPIPLTEDEQGQATNMLKEIICNSNFFNKYLDRYKLIVNKQNIKELILELQQKLQQKQQQLYQEKKKSIKVLCKDDIDTMMKIFETDKLYPSEYLDLCMYKDNEKYLAVDNTSGEMYIEEFDTEEECINYLFGSDE